MHLNIKLVNNIEMDCSRNVADWFDRTLKLTDNKTAPYARQFPCATDIAFAVSCESIVKTTPLDFRLIDVRNQQI